MSDSFYNAINHLNESDCKAVPVLDDNKQLLGVFNREVIYQVLLKNISLKKKIDEHVIKFQGSPVYKYADVKKCLLDDKVSSIFIMDCHKQIVGSIGMADMLSYARKIDLSNRDLGHAIFSNFLDAVKTNKDKIIVVVGEGFLLILKQDYAKIEKLLKSAIPELSFSLNFIHRDQEGSHRKILQLDSKAFTDGSNDFIPEEIKELRVVKRGQNMLDTIIELLYDGVVIVDEQGKILFLNHKIPNLFNIDIEKSTGKPIKEVLPILNLDEVVETGVADLSRVIVCNGVLCIVQSIPVIESGIVVGVVSRIVYHGINETRERMIHYDLTYRMDETLENIERFKRLNKLNNINVKENSPVTTFDKIITEDNGMKKTVRQALKAAKGRSTILVRGESGAGKELFAQAIHNASARKDRPFITVNCAAIPEHLLESEFFGYEQGAFTGAEKGGKIGKFDLANGGTLFLDEIGDMASSLQAKLLRVLQDRVFYRVGGMEQIHVDVRIIAATHRNLEEMIKNGEFREDLYYRLNVVTIDIPALRERQSDIIVLMKRFMRELNEFLGTSIIGIDQAVEEIFLNYSWPGNIRELKNVIESAMTFSDNRILQVEDLPKHIQKNRQDIFKLSLQKTEDINPIFTEDKNVILEDARQLTERQMIVKALQQTQGNKTKAAKVLGISRSVLYEKLYKYQLR